jgi:hypothetical protein
VRSVLAVAALSLAGILFNAIMIGPFALRTAAQGLNDFRQLYTAGLLAGSEGMYIPEKAMRVQEQLVGQANPRMVVVRPPFYGLLLKPLTLLPYRVALYCWLIFQVACIFAFVFCLPLVHRGAAAVFCCWSYPLLFALAIAQDVPLLLLAIGLSARLYQAERLLGAGLALSVCLIKFHFLSLLPLFILGRREWRLAQGFLMGCGTASALSLAAAGWTFPLDYVTALRGPNANASPGVMPNLNGLRTILNAPLWAELVSGLAVALAVWLVVRNSGALESVAATTAGGLLLSHHAYTQDCSILIPGLLGLLVAGNGKVSRTLAFVLLSPVIYIPFRNGQFRFVPAFLMLLLVLVLAFETRRRTRPSPVPAPTLP